MEQFLTSLKLEKYVDAFRQNGLDGMEVLLGLDDSQFDECMTAIITLSKTFKPCEND